MTTTRTADKGKWITVDMTQLDKTGQELLRKLAEQNKVAWATRKALSEHMLKDRVPPEGKAYVIKPRGTVLSIGLVDASTSKGAASKQTLAEFLGAATA